MESEARLETSSLYCLYSKEEEGVQNKLTLISGSYHNQCMIIVKKAHNHVKTTDKILRGIQ